MQALTAERLRANAYRTLGLSASAGQADVDAAARRMRIWPDPARIPPTPWDLPFLGPVARSRGDIEQALARLNDPASRVEERVLWYACASPPARAEFDAAADRFGAASGVAERHAAALSMLHAAILADGTADAPRHWRDAMGGFKTLCASDDFLAWLGEAEAAGDFDKRASLDEIYAAVRSIPVAVADAVVPHLRAALDRGDPTACAGLVSIIREGDAAGTSLDRLADALEDVIDGHCRQIDAELRDALRTRREAPEPFYAANYAATFKAAGAYNAHVDPALSRLRAVAGDDLHRMTRAKTRCADLLSLLGLGWEWSGKFVTAERTLLAALELASGSPGEAAIRKDLERVRPLAEHERLRDATAAGRDQPALWQARAAAKAAEIAGDLRQPQVAPLPSGRPKPVKRSGNRLGWAAIVAIILVLRGIATLVQSDSGSGSGPHPVSIDPGVLNSTLRDLRGQPRTRELPAAPGDTGQAPSVPLIRRATDLPATPHGAGGGVFDPDADPGAPPPGPPPAGDRPPSPRVDSIGEVNREP
jgi:hypothetical protein